jgi:hypothetical protein
LLIRREALDGAVEPQKAEKIRWKRHSLKSLRKAERSRRQLELNGLDATPKQSIASNTLEE